MLRSGLETQLLSHMVEMLQDPPKAWLLEIDTSLLARLELGQLPGFKRSLGDLAQAELLDLA